MEIKSLKLNEVEMVNGVMLLNTKLHLLITDRKSVKFISISAKQSSKTNRAKQKVFKKPIFNPLFGPLSKKPDLTFYCVTVGNMTVY